MACFCWSQHASKLTCDGVGWGGMYNRRLWMTGYWCDDVSIIAIATEIGNGERQIIRNDISLEV